MTAEHLVISLPVREMEAFLDGKGEWELLSSSPYQIGAGYGARIEVLVIMRRKIPDAEGRQRRKPVPPIPAKNNSARPLTANARGQMAN